MPWKSAPELWDIVGAFIISVVSALVSITRRVANGHHFTIIWFISEFMSAILAGYLMWTVYPNIQDNIPDWFTLPLAVALSAHAGGRMFQEIENEIVRRYTTLFDRRK